MGYTFVGWDIDFSEVTSNLTVKAMYEEILEEYEVVFLNKDGEIIKTQIVIENESATAPNPPAVFGYTFVSWDLDFSNVVSNLEIRPIYEIRTYSVKFMSDNNLLKEEFVTYEGKATPPEVNKTGYKFIGWDQDVTRITRNLNINAVWQKIVHASYVSSFNFSEYKKYNDLLETLETSENLYYTFSDVKYGGTRGTNELVYYDETLTHNTNIYGLEVAIDSDGLVVEKATKVSIPTGGFVLSGHGSSNTLLDNTVQIGDYITYSDNNAYIYRNHQINNIISLAISLDKIKLDILKQDNLLYALDYQEIENIYNQVVSIYNLLLDEYVYAEFSLAEELLLTINFMLIEPKASTVRAVWHYPIRSSGYNEMNTYEVGKYLDKVKSIGINRIYLNTNFNGGWMGYNKLNTNRIDMLE